MEIICLILLTHSTKYMKPHHNKVQQNRLPFYVMYCTVIFCLKHEFIFSHALHVALWSHFGKGVGPIWLDDVNCPEVDQGFSGCTHRGWGTHDCTHDNDVGLECGHADNMYRGGEGAAIHLNAQGEILSTYIAWRNMTTAVQCFVFNIIFVYHITISPELLLGHRGLPQQSGRSPKVVALFLLQTLVAI